MRLVLIVIFSSSTIVDITIANFPLVERKAGVPDEKIVEAHGSFATQRCIDCHTDFSDDLMKVAVENGDVPHCLVPECNGLVKPDIVFFGEPLPNSFFNNREAPQMADLIVTIGWGAFCLPSFACTDFQ